MSDTLGFGLISLMVGIYLLVSIDNKLARYLARSRATMQRCLRIDLGVGEPREEQWAQKRGIVMMGVICIALSIAMITIGGY